MNNAQKGSPHFQFAHSPHRQRVISMTLPSGMLIERVGNVNPLVDYKDMSAFPGYNDSGIWTNLPFTNYVGIVEIIDANHYEWLVGSSNTPTYNWCRETGETANIFTGVGTFNQHVDWSGAKVFGKMRISPPAWGMFGFYETNNISTTDPALISTQAMDSGDPITEVFPPAAPTPSGGTSFGIVMFFFGVSNPALVPAAIPRANYLAFDDP